MDMSMLKKLLIAPLSEKKSYIFVQWITGERSKIMLDNLFKKKKSIIN